MNRFRAAIDGDDSGLTLVEIVIYMLLATIVGTIVVSMFIGTIKGQDQITSTTEATTRGQVAAQSIEKAIRNSTASSVSGDGKTLMVLTTLSKQCQGWRLSGTDLQISTNNAMTTWKTFATGVTPASGTAVFGYSGSTITYGFSLATDTRPVKLTGGAVPRGTGGNLVASCS
jgi:Tfp pilus assembly protein FimT